jgi:hypothetical protein
MLIAKSPGKEKSAPACSKGNPDVKQTTHHARRSNQLTRSGTFSQGQGTNDSFREPHRRSVPCHCATIGTHVEHEQRTRSAKPARGERRKNIKETYEMDALRDPVFRLVGSLDASGAREVLGGSPLSSDMASANRPTNNRKVYSQRVVLVALTDGITTMWYNDVSITMTLERKTKILASEIDQITREHFYSDQRVDPAMPRSDIQAYQINVVFNFDRLSITNLSMNLVHIRTLLHHD